MDKKVRSQFLLICSATFLVFFRAKQGMSIYGFDDRCYVDWLFRFLGTPYSSVCQAPGIVYPGAALFWLPAGLLGLGLAKLFHGDPNVWIPPCVGFVTFFFWCTSLALVHRVMSRFGIRSLGKAFFVFLAMPVLFYSVRRTTMSHSVEFLICIGALNLVLDRRYGLAFVLSILATVTRINDAPIVLLLFGQFLDSSKKIDWRSPKLRAALVGTTLLSLPVLYIAFFRGYGGIIALPAVFSNITMYEWKRTLTNGYYGLLWSGNIWLVVFLAGVSQFPRLSYQSKLGLLWMFLLLLVCVGWGTGGGCIFSRYLIGTYAAGLLVGLEVYTRGTPRMQNILRSSLAFTVSYVLYLTWQGNTRFPLFWAKVRSPELTMGFVMKEQIHAFTLWGLSPVVATLGSLATRFSVGKFPAEAVLDNAQLFLMVPLTLAAVVIFFLSVMQLIKKDRGAKRIPAGSPDLTSNATELLRLPGFGNSQS